MTTHHRSASTSPARRRLVRTASASVAVLLVGAVLGTSSPTSAAVRRGQRTTTTAAATGRSVAPQITASPSVTVPVTGRSTATIAKNALPYSFDGMSLDAAARAAANGAELRSYGTIAVKGVVQNGQLWMTVHKDRHDVYYHLSEVKEVGGTDGSLNGYRILAKNQETMTYYRPGTGGGVPFGGNAVDAFTTTEWKMSVNSSLMGSPRVTPNPPAASVAPVTVAPAMVQPVAAKSARAGARTSKKSGQVGVTAPGPTPTLVADKRLASTTLVDVGSVMQVSRFTADSTFVVGARGYQSNGRQVAKTAILNSAVAPMANLDCNAVGETVKAFAISQVNGAAADAAYGQKLAAVVVAAAGAGGEKLTAGAGGITLATGALILGPLTEAGINNAAPFWGATATKACNRFNPTTPSIKPVSPSTINVGSPGIRTELVCTEYTDITTGTIQDNPDGSEEVTISVTTLCTKYDVVEY